MHPALATLFAVSLLTGAGLSLWIAIREFRRARGRSQSIEAAWPFEFPVHWLDYYAGPRLARYCRFGQVALYGPVFVMGAIDVLFADGSTSGMMLMSLVLFFSAAIRGFVPIPCRMDDRGIQFQEQAYPWKTVRRWNLNDRRLQLVAARSTNRALLYTLEIPLNGLPPALRPWLAEQMEAHLRAELAGRP